MDQIKMLKQKNNQSGQIIVVLLLIVVVVLAIGLSVVGRSNTEVLTASKIENSARAFSAAEAGIEHAVAINLTGAPVNIPFTSNNSNSTVTATVYPSALVPNIEQQNIGGTGSNSANGNVSYSFAQFWFANPTDLTFYNTPSNNPINNRFAVYFGDPLLSGNESPALEVHVIYKMGGSYSDAKYYLDSNTSRTNALSISGNVKPCDANGSTLLTNFSSQQDINTSTPDRKFLCRVQLSGFPWSTADSSKYPILVRIRVLYSTAGQNVAIGPSTGDKGLLPPQINVYSSTGISGDSQRTVQVTRETDVMPYLFDFALYSDNTVSKQ